MFLYRLFSNVLNICIYCHATIDCPAHFAPRLHLISPLLAHLICMACPTGCKVPLPHGLGASLLGQIVGVGLLALLDWVVGGVASLGISRKHKYSWLSGTSSADHTGSFRSAVGRYSSSSESICGIGRGIMPHVRCWWTPSKNGRLQGHLGVKGGDGVLGYHLFSQVIGGLSGKN